MSGAITTPATTVPLYADPPLITSHLPAYTYGSWVELISSATGNVAVAGLVVTGQFGFGNTEVDVGIGAAGAEVSLGWNIRLQFGNSGNVGPSQYLLRVPAFTGSVAGDRICLRTRGNNLYQLKLGLIYYTDPSLDCLHARPTSLPKGAVNATVVPSATPWDNSAWTQITTGLPTPIYIMGVAFGRGGTSTLTEWDVDIAVTNTSTIIGTVDGLNIGSNRTLRNYLLPALYYLPAGEPIWVRMRQASSDTTNWEAALLYYDNIVAEASTIVVEKVIAGGGPGVFTFTTTNLSPGSFTLGDGAQQLFEGLTPGSGYGVVETALDGYILESITVSNGSPNTNITVADGEIVTVIFTNGPAGHPACYPLFPTAPAECDN